MPTNSDVDNPVDNAENPHADGPTAIPAARRITTDHDCERLTAAVALRANGDPDAARPLLIALAAEFPDDANAQYQAGWVHDRLGLEHDALPYYQRALQLQTDLSAEDREGLHLALGSTLRNVGQLDASLAVLRSSVLSRPEDLALPCFVALTQHSAGQHAAALATLLDVALRLAAATPDAPASAPLLRYTRALRSYEQELRDEAAASAVAPQP